ncbi:FtsX-like permease family protein [Streptomyces galbus]|uniref:FtsX-like permease family protein n=1 Tax=Streptomyces galbus TaxID=33898 RepID=A0ABX1IN70_STRGB|nr:FtsX-like permease family protein [Streptomyces galbus]NKQ25622.1 FtsX-like permease family protein [Streptomyces galbus]
MADLEAFRGPSARATRLPHAPPLRPATLAALAALGRVTPDRSFPVRLPGGPDGLVGHPWSTARFAPYALTAGRAPAAPDEVVTAGGRTRPGARLRTSHGTVTVVGTVRAAGPERPVFFTDARAAALAPEVRQAVVEADATAVRAALRGDARVRVLTGAARRLADADPDRDAEALTALNALFGTAGGVSGFVSVFVVSSTFAFAVAQRRREFALLRTAGATPGQLRRAVLVEALLVGALASAAGCALGAYAAPHLAALVVDGGLAPAWYRVGGAVWPYHVAFWTGLSVALAGASSAAWRAGRTPAVDALREVSVDPGRLPRARWVCGAVLLLTAAATLAYTLLTDPGDLLHRKTWVSRPLLLISGVAVLSPALVRPLARLLVRLPGVLGLLVRQNVLTGARRTASLAAPVLVTVALAGSLLGATATLGGARAAEVDRQTAADFVVTPADGTPFAPAALARLRRGPGAEVSATATTAVQTLEDGVALVAFPARAAEPGPLARTVRLPVTAGHLADLDDDAIVVTREWARHRVGERVRIWRGDGTPRTLRVVAVLATGTGGTGAYVTPANAPGAGVDRVDVRVRAGASAAAVARHLRTVEGVRLRTKAQWVRASWPAPNRTTRLGVLLVLGIALLYTGLSVANTALMATAARRTELTTLRLTGLTRAQILRLTALETLTAVALGAALGVLVTLTGLSGLTAALHLLGSPPALTVPWRPITWTTTACALLSLTATSTATARSLSGAGVGGGN